MGQSKFNGRKILTPERLGIFERNLVQIHLLVQDKKQFMALQMGQSDSILEVHMKFMKNIVFFCFLSAIQDVVI